MTAGAEVPRSERLLRNAYRVLGLPGEAEWQAIRAAAEREEETAWDLPWLGPLSRRPAERALALTRLTDPHQRLRERLLWFHEGEAEDAVRDLAPGSLRNAMEGWGETSVLTARHDAALVALLAAIVHDPRVAEPSLWLAVLWRWREVLEAEEYWAAVIRVEREGSFDVPAPFGEIYEVRENALGMIADIPAGIARAAALDGDLDGARRAIALLREGVPEELFAARIGNLDEQLAEELGPRVSAPAEAARTTSEGPRPPEEVVTADPAVRGEAATAGASGRVAPPAVQAAVELPAPVLPGPPPVLVSADRVPSRSGRRAAALATLGLGILAAAVLLVFPLRNRSAGDEVGSGDAVRAEDRSTAASLEHRMDANDTAIAGVLLARQTAARDVGHLESSVRDYQALIEDYRRRSEYRLNVDPEDYSRVVTLHDEAVAQYMFARARLDSIDRSLARLREEGVRLIEEHNALIR